MPFDPPSEDDESDSLETLRDVVNRDYTLHNEGDKPSDVIDKHPETSLHSLADLNEGENYLEEFSRFIQTVSQSMLIYTENKEDLKEHAGRLGRPVLGRVKGGLSTTNESVDSSKTLHIATSDTVSPLSSVEDLVTQSDLEKTAKIDGSSVNTSANNLSSGWYTIASNSGNRAIGRFGLQDTNSGDHQSIVFYASHHYGNGNGITVLHSGQYNGTPYKKIRIKSGGTYDGALLQVYIDNENNDLKAYLLGDEFQTDGWAIQEFIPNNAGANGINESKLNNIAAEINLDHVSGGGIATTGDVISKGNNLTRGGAVSQNHGDGSDGYIHYTTKSVENRNIIWADGLKINSGVTVNINKQLVIHSLKPVVINGILSGKGEGGVGGNPPSKPASEYEEGIGHDGQQGDIVGGVGNHGDGGKSGYHSGRTSDFTVSSQPGGVAPERSLTDQEFEKMSKVGMFNWENWYENTYIGGSGGGSGGSSPDNKGGAGGDGGGIIIIIAPRITGSGIINCDGENGGGFDMERPGWDAPGGPGGGGCGGFIFLQGSEININTSALGGDVLPPKDGGVEGRYRRRNHGDASSANKGKNGIVKTVTR